MDYVQRSKDTKTHRYQTEGRRRKVFRVSRFPGSNSTVSIGGSDSTDSAATTLSSSGRKCHVGCIVASRVYGTRIGQMERERLSGRLCSCICLRLAVPCTCNTRIKQERVPEREKECRWVGCEPLPLGTCAVFE